MRRPTRSRACNRKAWYPSWERANAVRLQRVATGEVPAGLLQVYRCNFCGWFHMGHKSKRIRQQAMRAS